MQHGNKAFLLHLASPEQVPDFVAHGYTFRGHQLQIAPVKSTTIVVLDRVSYGLPNEAIKNAVAKYGTVSGLKAIAHNGYSMSKYRLEIELRQDIPSRINVQGNPVNVFYKNQPRSCLVCHEASHEAKNCPRKAGPACPPNQSTGPLSFAAIMAGEKTPVIPVHTDEFIADHPSTTEPGQQPKVDEPPTMVVEESAAVVDPKTIPPSDVKSVPPSDVKSVPPSDVKSVPPPQPESLAPPAQPVVESVPSSDHTVVPPASDENVRLPSVVESQKSSNKDTHPPPPVLDDLKSSSTEAPINTRAVQTVRKHATFTPTTAK